ncbi:MAG: hypothetical protein RB292_04240 [Patescibacteria group bacterium]|jgi:hypothetical protein|nr:hypothetical protein [Patescibacteria group bacterium]
MDYTSRLVLAFIIGGGVGFGISYVFGNPVGWILVGAAVALATDSAWQTIRNSKKSSSNSQPTIVNQNLPQIRQKLPKSKPPKFNF